MTKVLCFFLLGQLCNLFFFWLPLKKNRIIFNSTANVNYNFNSQYLFEYFVMKYKKYDVKYVINDEVSRAELISKYGDLFINTYSMSGFWYAFRAKLWVTSVMETPIFTIGRHPHRKVYHLGHGVPLKKIGLAEERISLLQWLNRFLRTRLFTHVACYSEDFKYIMEDVFRNVKCHFVALGQARNDSLSLRTKAEIQEELSCIYPDLPEHKAAILYAPTWRPYDVTKFFPYTNLDPQVLNSKLKDADQILFLRRHPYFPSYLEPKYENLSHIIWLNSDIVSDISSYLAYFDKLITDYSSIYLDFLCLNRPIAFIPYDLKQYEKEVGFSMPYEKLMPGSFLEKEEQFFDFLTEKDNKKFEVERARLAAMLNTKVSGNCHENAIFIINNLLI